MKKQVQINNIEFSLYKEPRLLNCDYFFKSAVLIPFFFQDGEMHILFEIRSKGIKQPGEVCFPGGQFDINDKTFKKTAIRETMEELSLKRNQIKYIGKLGSFVNITGVFVDAFIAEIEIDNINQIKFHKEEVEQVFALPLSFFKKNLPEKFSFNISINPDKTENGKNVITFPAEELKLPSKYQKSREINNYPVYVYRTQFGVIWGITAFLLMKFVERINIK